MSIVQALCMAYVTDKLYCFTWTGLLVTVKKLSSLFVKIITLLVRIVVFSVVYSYCCMVVDLWLRSSDIEH